MYLYLENLTKRYDNAKKGEADAVSDVSLEIEQGELIALLGPSGSGKTTLLRMIAGIEAPTGGHIYINGECVDGMHPAERQIGFVFQNYALFRYMTVYENIAFGLKVQKQSASDIRKRVEELLMLTELQDLRDRYPSQLSGGQQQRVAFARALATKPKLLLLDEPFAAIDAKVRKELRKWLKDMIHEVGITSIFVTHDQDEAVDMADRLVVMKDGKLLQCDTALNIYSDPSDLFTATFLGDPVILDRFEGVCGFPDINDGRKVVIRPEFVEAFRDDNPRFRNLVPISQEGVVTDCIFKGSFFEINLDLGKTSLICRRSTERRPVKPGDLMRVIVYRVYAFSPSDAGGAGPERAEVIFNDSLGDLNVEFI